MDRDRIRTILALAAPVVGGMVSQNIVNLADTAMVGRLGKAAVAAVGVSAFVNFLFSALVTGLSSAVQAIAARRVGEGREGDAAESLHGGLILTLVFGAPIMAAAWWFAPLYFPYLNADPAVIEHGVPYLRARLLGLVAVGVHFTFRGFWNGVGRPGLYLRTIVLMHIVYVAVSWTLIFGHFGLPALGTQGAGIGVTSSMWFGVAIYAVLAWRHGRPYGVGRAPMTRAAMMNLLRLALPTAIQQVLFAGGYTTLFWIIGKIGTDELAAANVLINLTMVALLPGMGLGMAGASLVGQALGRGQPEDARRWGWEVAGVACATMMLLGVPMVLAPEMILGWFVPDEPVAIALAAWPLRLVGGMIFLDAIGMTLMNALLGAGAVRQVSLISVGLQWGLALPLCYLVGPGTGGGLMAVWSVQVAQRALLAVAMSWVWWRGSWAGVRV